MISRRPGYDPGVSRQKRAPSLGDTPLRTTKGGARDRLRDAGSKELRQLANKVGNAQVDAMLGSAKEKRDALLAFIQERLAKILATQQAEQKELADNRDWWLRVSRGKPGFTLPDPKRWRDATLLYRRAAAAACAGDLGRAAHVLDQAVRAERAAFQSVPVQVELPHDLSAATATPDERAFVDEGEAAPPTHAPELFRTADTILRVTESGEQVPVTRNLPLHNWWEAPEEDAEDEKKDKKDDKGKKSPSPEQAADPKKTRKKT